jgi:hypothetical protein
VVTGKVKFKISELGPVYRAFEADLQKKLGLRSGRLWAVVIKYKWAIAVIWRMLDGLKALGGNNTASGVQDTLNHHIPVSRDLERTSDGYVAIYLHRFVVEILFSACSTTPHFASTRLCKSLLSLRCSTFNTAYLCASDGSSNHFCSDEIEYGVMIAGTGDHG